MSEWTATVQRKRNDRSGFNPSEQSLPSKWIMNPPVSVAKNTLPNHKNPSLKQNHLGKVSSSPTHQLKNRIYQLTNLFTKPPAGCHQKNPKEHFQKKTQKIGSECSSKPEFSSSFACINFRAVFCCSFWGCLSSHRQVVVEPSLCKPNGSAGQAFVYIFSGSTNSNCSASLSQVFLWGNLFAEIFSHSSIRTMN